MGLGMRHCCAAMVLSVSIGQSHTSWSEPLASNADDKGGSVWSPDKEPTFRGDVTQNDMVDIDDLVLLGKNWNQTQPLYRAKNQTLYNDIKAHWRESVPEELKLQSWGQRPQFFGKQLRAAAGAKSDGKGADPDVPLFVGQGVSFPNAVEWKPGLELFDSNGLMQQVGRPQDLEGQSISLGEQESGPDGIRRYDYSNALLSEKYESRYCRSYAEEYEFRGGDISLEAKYALFSGSLSAEFANSQYRDNTKHKLLIKAHRDFGWWYVPKLERQLFSDVADNLDIFATQQIHDTYGTHYIFAEHRFAELLIEFEFTTSTVIGRSEFASKAAAKFNGATSSFDFAASYQQFKSQVDDRMEVSIKIERRGGPTSLMANGQPIQFAQAYVDVSQILPLLDEYLQAWAAQVNLSNAATDDYYVRPITDFLLDAESVLPFSREANLRSWFDVYLEAVQGLDDLDQLVSRAQLVNNVHPLTGIFRYLGVMKKPNLPVLEGTTLPIYLSDAADEYADKVVSLLQAGRDLYEEKTDLFQKVDWPLWEIPIPGLVMLPGSGYPNDNGGNTFHIEFTLDGDFRATNGYEFALGDADNRVQATRDNIVSYDPVNQKTSVYIAANAWGGSIAGNNFAGMFIALRDNFISGQPFVSIRCATNGCSGVPATCLALETQCANALN